MANFLAYLRLPVLAASGIASVASGLLYYKQNDLIYPRYLPAGANTDEGVPRPSQFGVSDWEDLRIPTPDGEILGAFFIRASNKGLARDVTIMMFHGNAGNIGHRVPIAKVLEENTGCNVLMLEYRGYGMSTGTPDEKGLVIDAQAGLEWIRNAKETKGNRIVIYGQSLGGAVSIQLVERNQNSSDIVALILENTFTSIKDMIPRAFPPAKYIAWMCHQYWPSVEILPKIQSVPILFISGLKDEIVPPPQMKQLYNICQARSKTWRTIPNGDHNSSVTEPDYFTHIFEFLKDQVFR